MRRDDVVATTADGVALGVTLCGAGEPLLLISGLGASRHVFDPLVPSLARRRLVVTYDQRGIGSSAAGDLPITMTRLAADASTVLDSVAGGAADVLGASMGGAVAQQLVVDEPERVHHLVLAATAPPGAQAVPADPRARDALLGRGARTPADAYRIACTVLYSVAFQRAHPEFIDEQVRMRAARPVPARVFSAQLQALRAPSDVWQRLRGVRAPTLVAHGTMDAVAPVENARLLAGRIPGARARWFEGSGHLFFHERPEEAARVVEEFLRR